MLPQPPYAWALRETEGTQPSERVTVPRKLSLLCGEGPSQRGLWLPVCPPAVLGTVLLARPFPAGSKGVLPNTEAAGALKGSPRLKGDSKVAKVPSGHRCDQRGKKAEILMGTPAPTVLIFHRCRAGLALESERVTKDHSQLAGLAETLTISL